MCFLSVVIPIYNSEKYIDDLMESILAQKFQGYEVILVDDGSPDECPEICDESEWSGQVRDSAGSTLVYLPFCAWDFHGSLSVIDTIKPYVHANFNHNFGTDYELWDIFSRFLPKSTLGYILSPNCYFLFAPSLL